MLTSLLTDKLIRFENRKLRVVDKKYVNPPCNNSLATSFIKIMSSEEEMEVGTTPPIAQPDEIVEEGALETDEGVVERSVSLDPHLY